MECGQDDFITVDDLYPDMTPDQRQEAEQKLSAYLHIIGQIANRGMPEQANDEGKAEVVKEI